MTSGNKTIVINELERASSADINRAQALLAQDSHEYDRWRDSRDIRGSFYNNPGMEQAYTALPLAADKLVAHDCISGLMVRPDNAAGLLIDPGEAAFFVPAFGTPTADDSVYIRVSDPGVATLVTLPWLANAGPGIRWDIVECQPTEVVSETDMRDIFDPGTSTFVPTSVAKVRGGALTYRIRRGTAGAGIPNIDPAWMPLAAVHVRTDATGFQDSDVYDIRPLVSERAPYSLRHPLSPPSSARGVRIVLYEAEMRGSPSGGVNGRVLRGYFRSAFGGYWSGGAILRSLPSADASEFDDNNTGSLQAFDYEDPSQRTGGFALVANTLVALGCFFPRGYPRWVRYSEGTLPSDVTTRLPISGRFPNGPRGILMALNGAAGSACIDRNGMIEPIALPAIMGETDACWGHVVQYAAVDAAGTGVWPAEGNSVDGKYRFYNFTVVEGGSFTPQITTHAVIPGPAVVGDLDGSSGIAYRVDFVPGSNNVPISAEGVLVGFTMNMTIAAAGIAIPTAPPVAYEPGTGFGTMVDGMTLSTVANDSGSNRGFTWMLAGLMPLRPNSIWDRTIGPETFKLAINFSTAGAVSAGGPAIAIHGYQL